MSRAQHYLPSHCTGKGRTHEKKEQEGVREVDRATHETEDRAATKRGRDREREGESGQTIFPEIITTQNMKTYYFTVMLS